MNFLHCMDMAYILSIQIPAENFETYPKIVCVEGVPLCKLINCTVFFNEKLTPSKDAT